jgi:hypothetical protein
MVWLWNLQRKKELVAFEQHSSLFLLALFRYLIKISQKAAEVGGFKSTTRSISSILVEYTVLN